VLYVDGAKKINLNTWVLMFFKLKNFKSSNFRALMLLFVAEFIMQVIFNFYILTMILELRRYIVHSTKRRDMENHDV